MITTYGTNAGRINEVKGKILAHAVHVEVLALGLTMEKMPTNQGDNITYRRYLPFGATATNQNTQNRPAADPTAHIVQEGVTPPADQLTPVDVNVKQTQYACLYSYTDKAAIMYEDDIPEQQKIQCGERMGLVREMVRYGVLKACTNVSYSGGSSRATVDEGITLLSLRRMARTLMANHANPIKRMLAASPNYNTFGVEEAFIVFVHTDAAADIRDLPNFKHVVDYGQRTLINKREIGSCEEFRFVLSPELAPYNNSGATAAGTGLQTSSTLVDVYPFIVMAEDAAFDVALRGHDSFDVTHLPHTAKDKSDILGQRGYVGAKFWAAPLIVNGGWMGVIEAGVSDLA